MTGSAVGKLFRMFLAAATISLGGRKLTAEGLPPTNLKSDEDIVFFPTYGALDEDANAWMLKVHGKVFEPEHGSFKRARLISMLKRAIHVDGDGHAFLEERIRPFLVDNEGGKTVNVRLAAEAFSVGTTESNGHFAAELSLDSATPFLRGRTSQTVELKAILPDGDSRSFTGRVHLIAPEGVSVISDIDDTIKQSRVTDKSELMKNTFLRPFSPVEGMPGLYARLGEQGAAFHYISGSPWQLYEPIQDFLVASGFPSGSMHLKYFRVWDSSLLDILASQNETKLAAIEPLLHAFPKRRFLLIGDSGEQDPEIYGQIARQHPDQVIGIFIRNVTGSHRSDTRFSEAFREIPADRWELFDDVLKIDEKIIQCATRSAD